VAEGEDRAVVIIGGKLDVNATADKVSGNRVLLGAVWFGRTNTGPTNASTLGLSLALGNPDPYANFVKGPVAPDDVLDSPDIFGAVNVYERGDANEDTLITNSDMFKVKQLISDNMYKCYADCNNDGIITNSDMFCIKGKL
jgi:hypothetical protein